MTLLEMKRELVSLENAISLWRSDFEERVFFNSSAEYPAEIAVLETEAQSLRNRIAEAEAEDNFYSRIESLLNCRREV